METQDKGYKKISVELWGQWQMRMSVETQANKDDGSIDPEQ